MNNLKKRSMRFLLIFAFTGGIYAQEAKVNIEQPKAINKLLEFKKDIKTVETFRIQIYSGKSAAKAENVKSEFRQKFGEWPTEMVFNTPNYKIWIGNFRSRLEADRALLRIKKEYMYAFIFQPKKD